MDDFDLSNDGGSIRCDKETTEMVNDELVPAWREGG
jgi:hypothetical protein